jgi:type I restriction enzyme S subunit
MSSQPNSAPLPSGTNAESKLRTYNRAESAVFFRTKEKFGGFSNMASGFPLRVNGIRILTSEALYQACRFPHLPEVQRLIVAQLSPMTAKMKSKPHRKDSRPDWDRVRVKIMRWCLRVKLAQNWNEFSRLLLSTGDLPIVEESRKDDFWGAKVVGTSTLVGMNVLGRLLMELREEIKQDHGGKLRRVEAPTLANFLLFGEPVSAVEPSPLKSALAITELTIGKTSVLRQSELSSITPRIELPLVIDNEINQAQLGALIKGLRPYLDYKESGQPWVGAVPQHWPILPNRAIFTEVKDRDHPEEEMLSVTITQGIVRQHSLLADSSKKDSSNRDKSAYKLVQPCDLAYNKMRAWQGAIGVSNLRGIISPAYVVMRPRNAQNPRYFHHLFRTPAFAKEAERWSYGITSDMWSLRPEHFKMVYSPLPPQDEQAAIVRFLDHANHQVDRLIQTKKKMIALLNEQKQSIINCAVTRGLDSDVPLKPSEIPWLGDIPHRWTLKRFKFVASISGGQVDPRKPQYCKLVLIAPNHIQSGTGKLIGEETAAEQGADSGKYLVQKSQIIYSKIRPNLRKATIAPRDCLCSADMYPVSPNSTEISADYLLLVLLSLPFTNYAVDCSMRVAMPKVNREALANCWLWFPQLHEQNDILRFVQTASLPFEAVIYRMEREIALIREYRTRLITDVVTGKLDVREAALQLPVDSADTTIHAQEEPIEEDDLSEKQQIA